MKNYNEFMGLDLNIELGKQEKILKGTKENIKELKKILKEKEIRYTKNNIKLSNDYIRGCKLRIKLFEYNIKDCEKDVIDFKGLPTYIKKAEYQLEKNKYDLIMEKRKIIMKKKYIKGIEKWLKTLEGKEYEFKAAQDRTSKH